MDVKIFQASGIEEIDALEEKINEWSHTQPGIQFVETAMCQVQPALSSERLQHYVVSVWYAPS